MLQYKCFFRNHIRNTQFLHRFFSFGQRSKMASLYAGVFVRKMSPFVIFTNQTMIFTDRDFFLTNDYFNKLPYVYYRFSSDFSL